MIIRHRSAYPCIAALVGVLLLTSCDNGQIVTDKMQLDADRIRMITKDLDGDRIMAADKNPNDWVAHGRTYAEERHSPLTQINVDNVRGLKLAWYANTDTKRGLEASPIVINGVMFSSGSWSTVFAHNAATGEQIWKYDPQVPKVWGMNACCDVVNRGVAVWKGRVYVGTLDGRLVALDAGTGKPVWERVTVDQSKPYTITGAPRIVRDMVIIGNGGAEYGVRGYITAYNTETGKQLWRFYTVPGDPAKDFEGEHLRKAAPTWRGRNSWQEGGGGTVWDSMAYDPKLNLLYIGVGNGSPWNRYVRSPGGGDNLYLSSIVAINPDRGEMVWHYQTTPGDTWDYTATQHMILADMQIGGQMRKVIMQAPKNGFFYVLDRTDGSFISAEAYVPVNWALKIDPETGRPVENPAAHYVDEARVISPSPFGGHNWHPMSYSPATGLVYIPALEIPFLFDQDEAYSYNPMTWNLGIDFQKALVPAKTLEGQAAGLGSVRGHLAAWDPVTQKQVWKVQHDGSWNGGVLSTAGGLVFQGQANGNFAAYRADNGELLWEMYVQTGIIAPPVSYMVNGEQYIVVQAGWGGAFAVVSGVPLQKGNLMAQGRILAFKLNGEARLPAPRMEYMALPEPPADIQGTESQVAMGEQHYHRHCSVCHGSGAGSSGPIPDLRYSREEVHAAWEDIVLNGAYIGKGMRGFNGILNREQVQAIQYYVVNQARNTKLVCDQGMLDRYGSVFEGVCDRPMDVGGGSR